MCGSLPDPLKVCAINNVQLRNLIDKSQSTWMGAAENMFKKLNITKEAAHLLHRMPAKDSISSCGAL